jgi:AcrR family transcriptional regulator
MSGADEQGGDAGDVDRILKAAREALRRAGYENMKVKSVIRNAGVSVGGFYRRFSGKDELMLALLTEEARRNTRFLNTVTAEGTPAERVLAWVDATAGVGFKERAGARTRWFTSMPSEVRKQLHPIAQQDPDADMNDPLHRAIADGIASGDFPHADADSDTISVSGLCIAAAQTTGWFGGDREAVVGNVARFVLAALTNPLPRTPPISPTDVAPAS